jgi:hypothetical protein
MQEGNTDSLLEFLSSCRDTAAWLCRNSTQWYSSNWHWIVDFVNERPWRMIVFAVSIQFEIISSCEVLRLFLACTPSQWDRSCYSDNSNMSRISRSNCDHGWDKMILKSRSKHAMILTKSIACWITEDSVTLSDGLWELSIWPLVGVRDIWMAHTWAAISFGDMPCRSNEVPSSNTSHHHPKEYPLSLFWNRSDEIVHHFSHSLEQDSIV